MKLAKSCKGKVQLQIKDLGEVITGSKLGASKDFSLF